VVAPEINLYQNDLPGGLDLGDSIAIDTETLGLNPHRDRLCLVQISAGDNICHMVQFPVEDGQVCYEAPNLRQVLTDTALTKIFHFGRFDIAMLYRHLGIVCKPVYCTKIASKLVRTYTDRHGLKDLSRELLGVEISKEQQTTDWGAPNLSPEQLKYAAGDVLYLHNLRSHLNGLLEREGRTELAGACFEFLPHRARLDVAGWNEIDIFAH